MPVWKRDDDITRVLSIENLYVTVRKRQSRKRSEHLLKAFNVFGQGGLFERVRFILSPSIHPVAKCLYLTGKQLFQAGGCFASHAAAVNPGDGRKPPIVPPGRHLVRAQLLVNRTPKKSNYNRPQEPSNTSQRTELLPAGFRGF